MALLSVQQAASLERKFDIIILVAAFTGTVAGYHIHQMLTVGDWDFWLDWKDRRWWVTLTPILLITFPAASQYFMWEKMRLPIGATFCIMTLHFGQWMNRVFNFYYWAWFPVNFTTPGLMIPSAIFLDVMLMMTGSYMFTALFGGMGWSLLFYPANWTWLAPFHLAVKHPSGPLMSIADLMGMEYVRSATPEYIRIVERGTLRTFGRDVTPVSSFFAGFISGLVYVWWMFMGKWISKPTWLART
ncbi:MAG: methane monooxygenase/ammonia monooxygenase subunit A [Candidatus Methylomirabilota bacterium]|nr:methane monooxygenase/ammonia monooxygenase subunit A [Candidatus Methylomirabilis sp.]NJD68289.1 methane monooxygenase/ammonia monooxygenase subunit A [candidate division NC10 bacterium]PWB42337.1 MAG: methane monooxygenase/ammonia monooxygenase subunit A [candidate division NC10 bacterium]